MDLSLRMAGGFLYPMLMQGLQLTPRVLPLIRFCLAKEKAINKAVFFASVV
jgi:hypothetical protein